MIEKKAGGAKQRKEKKNREKKIRGTIRKHTKKNKKE